MSLMMMYPLLAPVMKREEEDIPTYMGTAGVHLTSAFQFVNKEKPR
ncbi:hypothetical protein ALQ71_00792 [Pseudomonas coronafaciens pv. striafaciens]|nr:hypothetical protein ALQ71_00792 [Pseudomonas coronafaciens pv. striafaciens]RMP32679.1 hypothetical protein ALQ25_02966 [Pseudomonas coronafaciens pv. atropurpurea]